MSNVLSAEWVKLKKSKSYKVCFIITVALGFLVLGSLALTKSMFSEEMMQEMASEMGEAYSIYQNDLSGSMVLSQLFSGGDIQLVFAVFVSIFVAMEFSNGTIKNIASRGYSRIKFYLGKVIISSLAVTIMITGMLVVVTLVASLIWGFGHMQGVEALDILVFLLVQFCLNIAISLVFVAVAMVVQSNGVSIAINLVLVMLVPLVFTIIDLIFENEYNISQYWIGTTISEASLLPLDSGMIVKSLIVALVYGGLSTVLGGILFHNRDIK